VRICAEQSRLVFSFLVAPPACILRESGITSCVSSSRRAVIFVFAGLLLVLLRSFDTWFLWVNLFIMLIAVVRAEFSKTEASPLTFPWAESLEHEQVCAAAVFVGALAILFAGDSVTRAFLSCCDLSFPCSSFAVGHSDQLLPHFSRLNVCHVL
jgi:hypothetical protein